MPKSSVPDRWTDYDPFLTIVKGTRFLPIKVPLKQAICNKVDPDLKFTPEDFLDLCRKKSLKIGLIIDLTFTTRYYDFRVFESQGIIYKKIATYGGVAPNFSVRNEFASVVSNFLENDNTDSLIAVHCTHGVNRTGFLVCHYMITELNTPIEEAIASFADARGHPIERPNYLQSLRDLKFGETSLSQEESLPGADHYQANPTAQAHGNWRHPANSLGGWKHPANSRGDWEHPANSRGDWEHPANSRGGWRHPANSRGGWERSNSRGGWERSNSRGGWEHPTNSRNDGRHPANSRGGWERSAYAQAGWSQQDSWRHHNGGSGAHNGFSQRPYNRHGDDRRRNQSSDVWRSQSDYSRRRRYDRKQLNCNEGDKL